MADMDAVIDAPEVDEISAEPESGLTAGDGGAVASSLDGEAAAAPESDSPYTTRFARDMRAALEAWKQANPESAKYAKAARDNHARMFELTRLEPKGIAGVRETYGLLDSVIHGDLKGRDAVSAMQDALAGTQEVDEMLASGDPRVFERFNESFNEGLGKLAPAYLDRVKAANPEAFEAAVAPHIAESITNSSLVKDYNAIADILNTVDDPRLDEKTKLRLVTAGLGRMGDWLGQQMQKGGEVKGAAPKADGTQPAVDDQRTKFEKEKQTFHWENKIYPPVREYVSKQFDDLFKPYQMRLKLSAETIKDMRSAFVANLEKAGNADGAYMKGINSYRKQGTPSADAVINYAKNGLTRHAKPVMDALVKARYGSFLNGKPKAQATTSTGAAKQAPVGPNVEVRTVKPPMSEIDHRNTPIAWLPEKKYRLYSGKVIQVRSN